MATFCKIPKNVKNIGCIAIGNYAIFCKGVVKAANVHDKLIQSEKKGIPAVGFLHFNKEKVYYCRLGFVNDKKIYQK